MHRRNDVDSQSSPAPLFAALVVAVAALACAPSLASADQWVISPNRDTSLPAVTRALTDMNRLPSLGAVFTGLSGTSALTAQFRLVDLDTGVVRTLLPLEASSIQWVSEGQLVTLGNMAGNLSQNLLVVSNLDGAGPFLVVQRGPLATASLALDADQRLLLGEPPCDMGYAPESSPSGTLCVDVDECTADLDDCDENASCTNTEGSYECACNPGFGGDGVTCSAGDAGTLETPDAGAMAPIDEPTSDAGERMTTTREALRYDDFGSAACTCSAPGAARGGSLPAGLSLLLALCCVRLLRRTRG